MKKAVPTTEKNEMKQNTAENLDTEPRKTVPTIEKNEALQTNKVRLPLELKGIKDLEMIEKEKVSDDKPTNRGRLLMEQKNIKDSEMIEKEKVPRGKQANTAFDSVKSNESSSSAITKTKKMAADTEHGTHPHISASENVRKEWPCAICRLSMPSEANLNSHLQGTEHKAAFEALNTKTKGTVGTDTGNKASPQVSTSRKVQKIWTFSICQLIMLSYDEVNSHMQGEKHKAAHEALNTKTKATAGTDTGNKASPQVPAYKKVQKIWTCEICQLTMYGSNLNSHLQGKKHKAACEALNTKTKGTTWTDTGKGASPHVSAYRKVQKIWTCGICQVTMLSYTEVISHLQGKKHKAAYETLNMKTKATAGTNTGNEASPQVSARKNVQKIWTCGICQVTILSYPALNSHLQGKKHEAASEALNTKTEGNTGTDTGNGASSHAFASTSVRKFWTCDICQLTMLESNMSSHLQGKKHKATREALKVKGQLVA